MSAQGGRHDIAMESLLQEPASAGIAPGAAADAYPPAVSRWLIADLVLCAFNALFVLVGLVMLGGGADGGPVSILVIETVVHAGIAVFGMSANIALLRRRLSGAALAKIALAFVGAGMAVVLYEVPMRIDDPESTCPPETIVAGAAVGMAIRLTINLIWFDMVRRAQKLLRSATAHEG